MGGEYTLFLVNNLVDLAASTVLVARVSVMLNVGWMVWTCA